VTISELGDLILVLSIFVSGIIFIVVNVNYKYDDSESTEKKD